MIESGGVAGKCVLVEGCLVYEAWMTCTVPFLWSTVHPLVILA